MKETRRRIAAERICVAERRFVWPSGLWISALLIAGSSTVVASMACPVKGHFNRIGSLGGSVTAVEIEGSHLYASEGFHLTVFDNSEATKPKVIARVPFPSLLQDIDVENETAFVVDGDLRILDVSDPASPRCIASLVTPGDAVHVKAVGSSVYVADSTGGLCIVDVSVPTIPRVRATYVPRGEVDDVEVQGDNVFVAVDSNDIEILSVADPSAPVRVAGIEVGYRLKKGEEPNSGTEGSRPADKSLPVNLSPVSLDISLSGSSLFAVDLYYGLRIVDISEPTAPVIVGSYLGGGGNSRVTVVGEYVVIASRVRQIEILKWLPPQDPVLVGTLDYSPLADLTDPRDITANGSLIYLADTLSDLSIVDIAAPEAPDTVGSYETIGSPWHVDAAGSVAYVDENGLKIVDVSNPALPILVGSMEVSGNLVVSGSTAYSLDGESGLQMLDVRDPLHPTALGNVETPGFHIVISPPYAYVGGENPDLQVVDISNPNSPTARGTFDSAWNINGIDVVHPLVYLTGWYYADLDLKPAQSSS